MSARGGDTLCCGSSSYNAYTHICCNGTVFVRDDTTSCFGKIPYNKNNFMCCNGIVIPLILAVITILMTLTILSRSIAIRQFYPMG